MQTEAVSTDSPSELAGNGSSASLKDPMVLGVTLPLSFTKSAANQVVLAWTEALTAVVAAAKAKAQTKKEAAKQAASA